jgi:hypothetical protein
VPTGSKESQSLWRLSGWSCLLVLMGGADSIMKELGVVDLFSRVLVRRYLIRSRSQLVPGTNTGQFGVGGIPARLCLAGRKRSLMANFADR